MRKIRTGDEVVVISGRNKGQSGKVRQVVAETDRVVIEGVNIVIKHIRRGRARQAGRVEVEAALHVSNVMLLDPETKQPTRVGVRKYCMNRFYCSAFWIHEQDDRCTIGVVATRQCRENGLCTDSESQGLATKKFSSLQRWSLADALQSELFWTNRDHRFGHVLAVATTSSGSR